jgi:type IV secretion system protein VirB6
VKTAQNIDNAIDLLLLHFVAEKSAAICSMLIPVAISGITTYLILIGYSIGRGTYPDPAKEALWKIMRISFVAGISLSVGTYQTLIVGGLESIGGAIIETIAGVSTFAAVIDNMAAPYLELGQKIWSEATTGMWPHVGLLFAAAVVSCSQLVLFSIGLGYYLLAKVALALIMAIGPCFLLCAIWPSTSKYAENWLGQAMNYIFLKVLISTTVVMLTCFASQYAEHISTEIDEVNIIEAACSLMLTSIALAIVVIFHPQLASALFGGASVSGIGRALMHLLIHSLSKKKTSNPNSIQRKENDTPPRSNSIGSRAPLFQSHALAQLRRQH